MNGVASSSMREKGMVYKLNFGLMQEQIKQLAAGYEPHADLAELLWKEDTRELKILATLLYPIPEFTEETANRWLSEIPNQEIREQICINLFQKLPYAEKIAAQWSNKPDPVIRITGYWLMARLILRKELKGKLFTDNFSYIWEDILADDLFLRNASILVLKHIGKQSEQEAAKILQRLADYKGSTDLLKQEVYNNMAFEFEFFFG